MKQTINAYFSNGDNADKAISQITRLYPGAKLDNEWYQSIAGAYSYSCVLPDTNNAIAQTGLFFPLYPENSSLDEIKRKNAVKMQIKSDRDSIKGITKIILSCDGRIG